jgi:hypothetical protein
VVECRFLKGLVPTSKLMNFVPKFIGTDRRTNFNDAVTGEQVMFILICNPECSHTPFVPSD